MAVVISGGSGDGARCLAVYILFLIIVVEHELYLNPRTFLELAACPASGGAKRPTRTPPKPGTTMIA